MTVADTLAAVKEEWWRQVTGILDWIQDHYPNEACDHDFFEGKWDISVLDDFARYRQVLIDIHDFMTYVLHQYGDEEEEILTDEHGDKEMVVDVPKLSFYWEKDINNFNGKELKLLLKCLQNDVTYVGPPLMGKEQSADLAARKKSLEAAIKEKKTEAQRRRKSATAKRRRSSMTQEDRDAEASARRARRSRQSEEQADQRRAADAAARRTARDNETEEQADQRRAADAAARRTARDNETEEQTAARRAADAAARRNARDNETEEQTAERRRRDREGAARRRMRERAEHEQAVRAAQNNRMTLLHSKFPADKTFQCALNAHKFVEPSLVGQSSNFDHVVPHDVGSFYRMPGVEAVADVDMEATQDEPERGDPVNLCKYCGALRFLGESDSFCCGNGKVHLPALPEDPECFR